MSTEGWRTGPRYRVLFCTWDYFPSPAGGAERQARLQAEELVRRGHRVTVICPANGRPKEEFVNGVRVRRLPRVGRSGLVHRCSLFLSIAGFLFREGWRFDVVHMHIANAAADVVGWISTALGRPTYLKIASGGSAGEVLTRVRTPGRARWMAVSRATRVQALSTEIFDELISVGVQADRIVRIPNGIDLKSFEPVSSDGKRQLREQLNLPLVGHLYLFVGRLTNDKGVDDLFLAWQNANLSDAHLVIVGSADTPNPAALPEGDPTVIVRAYTNDIAIYYRACDIFVYPSYTDGMSNAVLEALSVGLVVVASRSGATAELLDESSALLFGAGDRSALARALQLAKTADRVGLAEHGRRAVAPLAIGRVVDRIEEVYAEVLS